MRGFRFLLVVVVAAVALLLVLQLVQQKPHPTSTAPEVEATNLKERRLPPLPAELKGLPIGKKPLWVVVETKRPPGSEAMVRLARRFEQQHGEHISVFCINGDDPKHADLLKYHMITRLPASVFYGTDAFVAAMYEGSLTAQQAAAALAKAEEAGCSGCQHEHHHQAAPPAAPLPKSPKGGKLG